MGGGRQAIHLLLLQRNGAARAPAHLSSASFADNGHLSSLSSAPMSSAQLTGRGGGRGRRVHEHRRAHMHMGLLDIRSCTYTQVHGTWGDTCPCVWIEAPWRQTHIQKHTQNSLICQADIPSWRFSSPVEETCVLGGGARVHAKGSLSAGGPLPALNVHTCDISRQHSSCPQALQELMCDCVPLAGRVWQHRGSQKLTLRFPRPLRHKDFRQVGRLDDGVMGWWMVR